METVGDSTSTLDVVRHVVDAVSDRRVDDAAALPAPDAEFANGPFDTVMGRDEVVGVMAPSANTMDETDWRITSAAADGSVALVERVVLFAVEATRRWAGEGITANALMPGGIWTNLQRHWDPAVLEATKAQAGRTGAAKIPDQGAGDLGAARHVPRTGRGGWPVLRGLPRGRGSPRSPSWTVLEVLRTPGDMSSPGRSAGALRRDSGRLRGGAHRGHGGASAFRELDGGEPDTA